MLVQVAVGMRMLQSLTLPILYLQESIHAEITVPKTLTVVLLVTNL